MVGACSAPSTTPTEAGAGSVGGEPFPTTVVDDTSVADDTGTAGAPASDGEAGGLLDDPRSTPPVLLDETFSFPATDEAGLDPRPTDDQLAAWDAAAAAVGGDYLFWFGSDRFRSIATHPWGVQYQVAVGDDPSELVDADGHLIDVPFGMPPGPGLVAVWPRSGADPSQRVGPAVWPVDCLGPSPDVDGDSLLDDCDPYPLDGPLADADGDGVANWADVCPTAANPPGADGTQDEFACDDELVHPTTQWHRATVTLEEWNETRAARGLAPLVMPDGPAELPAEVAEWCASGESFGPDTEFDVMVGFIGAFPAAYGLDAGEVSALQQLLFDREAVTAVDDELSFGEPTPVELAEYNIEVEGYLAPTLYSDLACP